MSEIVGTFRWIVATRPVSKQGIWHLLLSTSIFPTEELAGMEAARLTNKPNGTQVSYIYKPVRVFVSPVDYGLE